MTRYFAVVLVLLTACATQPVPSAAPVPSPAPAQTAVECIDGNALLAATLWVQSSAEYRVATMQTYANARRMLDAALADPSWTAEPQQQAPFASKPPAVILDLDETVIDNSRFEARTIRKGRVFDSKLWEEWVAEGDAGPVPGALEFLAYAKSRGVTPFYITNRDYPGEEQGTQQNLVKLGVPLGSEDALLTRGKRPEWKSDKATRRAHVAERYRVLLLIGDDLNDFANAREASLQQREQIVADNAARWGTQWHIMPNPMYGSWERALYGSTSRLSPCEQLQKRIDALKP